MKLGNRSLVAAALIFALAVFFAAFVLSTEDKSKNGKKPSRQETVSRTSAGSVVISEDAQKTGAITTEALKRELYQKHITAYGKILPPDDLNASRKSYIAALAGLEKAEAQLDVSTREYERLKALNADDKNVSDRLLQAAESRLSVDQAEETRARAALQSAKDETILEWGPILSGWIFDYSAPLLRILRTKDVLVKVAVPPADRIRAIPKEIVIEPPSGGSIPARFVSRATSADPRLQGMSFLYVAPSGSLLPGMDITAQLPSKESREGFLVPLSAVVWLQDKAWVYIKKTRTGFSRVEVPTSVKANDGYFVPGTFSPGDEIVVKGAQVLLSEETTPKAKGGGEEEEGDED